MRSRCDLVRQVGFFYAYNLYESCPEEVPSSSQIGARRMLAGSAQTKRLPRAASGAAATAPAPLTPSPGNGDTGLGAPCLGSAMDVYFGLNVTKVALGIPLDNSRPLRGPRTLHSLPASRPTSHGCAVPCVPWASMGVACADFIVLDNGIGFNYTTDSAFVGYVYQRAIAQGKRVLVYEGDSDACGLQTAPIEDIWVPFLGNGTVASDGWTPVGPLGTPHSMPLGLPQTQPWRPWGLAPAGRKVQGGFSMAWLGGQVRFASIRGAGHLAPLYRPAAAYTMMRAFQRDEDLPPPFYPKAQARGA